MNIALDAMGGDHAPQAIVAGAIQAARQYGITISLVGQPDQIKTELANHGTTGLNLPIIPATEVIEMGDSPTQAVRAKEDSSMVVACRLVREQKAQAFVTAGNTGGALTAGILHIGRTKGILRPALMSAFPTYSGICTLLDIGANSDVRPEYLPQFAIMGSLYCQHILGIANPRVSILSNGEEEGKGNQLVTKAYELLVETSGINFQGNIESQEVIEGKADVVVTDGFTGNIFIKTAEATVRLMQRTLGEELMRGPISSVGAFLSKAGFQRMKARLDDSEYGGAVLLGLSAPVIVGHGHSDPSAVRHAIRLAKETIEQNLSKKIQQGVGESL